MNDGKEYGLILFHSVHHALKAEKVLKSGGIAHKLIPVPKAISSDCGVCLRFLIADRAVIEQMLAGKAEFREIRII